MVWRQRQCMYCIYGENKRFFIRTFSTTDATEVKAPKISTPFQCTMTCVRTKMRKNSNFFVWCLLSSGFPHSCANNKYIPESRFVNWYSVIYSTWERETSLESPKLKVVLEDDFVHLYLNILFQWNAHIVHVVKKLDYSKRYMLLDARLILSERK